MDEALELSEPASSDESQGIPLTRLALINLTRKAMGKPRLRHELVGKDEDSMTESSIARSLGVEVGSEVAIFNGEKQAHAVAEVWGTRKLFLRKDETTTKNDDARWAVYLPDVLKDSLT